MNTSEKDEKSNGKCGCKCEHINCFEHLWKYFEIHANQRISLFRFYIAFFSFFIAAAGALLLRFSFPGPFAEISAILVSIVFFIISLNFHLLDRRNRQLIHYAEDGLRSLESKCIDDDECNLVRVFTKEKEEQDRRARHTSCFRSIYISAYSISGLLFLGTLIWLFCFSS